jgi:hypothetical protein
MAVAGMKREDIAARLGVGVASVYRVLAERRADRFFVSLNPLEQMNLLSRLRDFEEERFSRQSFCGLLRRR